MRDVPSYQISIFIAGDYKDALRACRAWCNAKRGCVTVTKTNYVYTGGAEPGVIVGMINYPPYPKEPEALLEQAKDLAECLKDALHQTSYSIQTPLVTYTAGRDHV